MTKSPSPSVDEVANGNAPLPFDRDQLGRFVREAWVRWAERQPNPKQSWLVQYDDLSEADKEADRQIGETVARWTIIGAAANASLVSPPKAGAGEQLKASCPGCNGTGNQGGNPLYGDCDDCGGTGSVTVSARVVDVPDIKLAIADYLQLRDESCGFDSTDEERAMSAAEIHDAVQTINAKLANHEARGDGVRVRPLEWRESSEGFAKGQWFAESAFGEYCTYMHVPSARAWLQGPNGLREFADDIDAAKATAQAHFDAEIRKCLLPPLGDGTLVYHAHAPGETQPDLPSTAETQGPLGDGRAEIVEALKPFGNVPEIPEHFDDKKTVQASLHYTMDAAEVESIQRLSGGALKSDRAELIVSVDGLTVGDFRRAAAAIRSLSNPGGSE